MNSILMIKEALNELTLSTLCYEADWCIISTMVMNIRLTIMGLFFFWGHLQVLSFRK